MIDVSRLIEKGNGSARTTPITRPRPGMMDTAMPIRRPTFKATRFCHLNTSTKPASRRCVLSTGRLSAHADERHDKQRDLLEGTLPEWQRHEDHLHEDEAEKESQQNCQNRHIGEPAKTAQPHEGARVDTRQRAKTPQ